MTKELRMIVEPTHATFSGYCVTIKWKDGVSFGWRIVTFTKWEKVFEFLAKHDINYFPSVFIHSEAL